MKDLKIIITAVGSPGSATNIRYLKSVDERKLFLIGTDLNQDKIGKHWCDVKESWDAQAHPLISTKNIVKNSLEYSEMVVVTGGEPLMWDMTILTRELKENNKKIHIETSGAYELTGAWDWICLSPKKQMKPVDEIYKKADELKVIVYNNDDFKFAEDQAKKISSKAHLFLQPEWENREKMMPIMVDYVKKNPKWKISLQTHKYLDIP